MPTKRLMFPFRPDVFLSVLFLSCDGLSQSQASHSPSLHIQQASHLSPHAWSSTSLSPALICSPSTSYGCLGSCIRPSINSRLPAIARVIWSHSHPCCNLFPNSPQLSIKYSLAEHTSPSWSLPSTSLASSPACTSIIHYIFQIHHTISDLQTNMHVTSSAQKCPSHTSFFTCYLFLIFSRKPSSDSFFSQEWSRHPTFVFLQVFLRQDFPPCHAITDGVSPFIFEPKPFKSHH